MSLSQFLPKCCQRLVCDLEQDFFLKKIPPNTRKYYRKGIFLLETSELRVGIYTVAKVT